MADDGGLRESVVLLHGFGATRRAWDGVARMLDRESYLALALDLPGHGEEGVAAARSLTCCAKHVLARCPERFTLCGYSLGGRVALHVALAAPARVRRLVLVSSTAGIDDPRERRARRRADERLAGELERAGEGGFEAFIERWRMQPLFAGEPDHVRALARADQRRNRPQALAVALRGLGTGAMQPLWARLATLTMPVTVLVGERDAKFRALGERLARTLPRGELLVVAGGHALTLENPAAIARALEGLDAETGSVG